MEGTRKKKRTYYSQKKKDFLVAAYKEWSGSLKSFCQYHELPAATFREWLTTGKKASKLEFVELSPKSGSAKTDLRPPEKAIVQFPNGIQVKLPLGCDQATILSICSTLGGL